MRTDSHPAFSVKWVTIFYNYRFRGKSFIMSVLIKKEPLIKQNKRDLNENIPHSFMRDEG
jgi:hypothetical protein